MRARVRVLCAALYGMEILRRRKFWHVTKYVLEHILALARVQRRNPHREQNMKIYWIKAQAPRQVLALVRHLGIAAQCVQLDGAGLRASDYATLNPNKKAPTLVDGDVTLWEASAIMAYLCIKAGSDMWPAHEPLQQVEVLRWLSWNDCHWARVVGPFYFEHVVKATFGLGAPDRESLQSKAA